MLQKLFYNMERILHNIFDKRDNLLNQLIVFVLSYVSFLKQKYYDLLFSYVYKEYQAFLAMTFFYFLNSYNLFFTKV